MTGSVPRIRWQEDRRRHCSVGSRELGFVGVLVGFYEIQGDRAEECAVRTGPIVSRQWVMAWANSQLRPFCYSITTDE